MNTSPSSSNPSMPLWNFKGEGVLISGGARGIGAGTVRHFARHGAEVLFGDIDAIGAAQLCEELKAEGYAAHFLEADFGEINAWPRLRKEAERLNIQPSLVVSNTGLGAKECVEGGRIETFDQLMDVNVRSAWLAARELGPVLRQRPGASLILVGSVMAHFGTPEYSIYSTTKAALSGLLRNLCVELQPVRVNMILPGFIINDPPGPYRQEVPLHLWNAFHARFGPAAAEANPLVQPLSFWGQPDDIAQAIGFLHSPAARYITGAELKVDGGLLCQSPIPKGSGNEAWKWTDEMRQWLKEHAESGPQ